MAVSLSNIPLCPCSLSLRLHSCTAVSTKKFSSMRQYAVWLTVLIFQRQQVPHKHQHIQGVSRLVDITAGGDLLGLCDQKSSYKHVSDFGWLRSYGHFLIPIHALV